MIATTIFKADKREFARLLFEMHGQGWLYGGAFLFIMALLLGVVIDYRLLILAVILVCLIAPALLLLLYYNYGMKGENFLNVLDHRIELYSDKLILFLKVKGENEESGKEESEMSEPVNMNRASEPAEKEWRIYEYPYSCFGSYSVGKDYVVFPLKTPKEGFLYLPVSAFDDKVSFSEAVKMINKDNNENNKG